MRKKQKKKSVDPFVRAVSWYLSRRKRKKYIQKVRQKRKNHIEDWGGALLWAACVVLLINQYFFQAYRIPSGSMEKTLEVGDMLFVNKMVYGPELIPGYAKVPGFKEPERGEIIIFESPEYIGKGPIRELFNRLVFMLTLSLANLDKDEDGNEAVHFLVKRAVGMGGDFVSYGENYLKVIPKGLDHSVREKILFKQLGAANNTVYRGGYDNYSSNLQPLSYRYFSENPLQLRQRYDHIYPTYELIENTGIYRRDASGELILKKGSGVNHNPRFMAMKDLHGFHIEEDYILPLGDNRNNSHDGRSWGPVHKDKVLGRVSVRYWPVSAFGTPR